MSACRSCSSEIVWARTSTGKRMPLDAQPDPDGIIVLVDGVAYVATGWGSTASLPADATRYTSHFATCPHADRHRSPQ